LLNSVIIIKTKIHLPHAYIVGDLIRFLIVAILICLFPKNQLAFKYFDFERT